MQQDTGFGIAFDDQMNPIEQVIAFQPSHAGIAPLAHLVRALRRHQHRETEACKAMRPCCHLRGLTRIPMAANRVKMRFRAYAIRVEQPTMQRKTVEARDGDRLLGLLKPYAGFACLAGIHQTFAFRIVRRGLTEHGLLVLRVQSEPEQRICANGQRSRRCHGRGSRCNADGAGDIRMGAPHCCLDSLISCIRSLFIHDDRCVRLYVCSAPLRR